LVRDGLFNRFSMSDQGESSQLLGMIIGYDVTTGILKLHQEMYVESLLEKYGEGDLTQYSTPAETNTYKQVEDFVKSKKEPVKTTYPYRQVVGTLLYLTCMTRPDIANIVRYLARFMNNFHALHVKFVKRVLGYLRGTKDVGIVYRRQMVPNVLTAYSDSSYADDYFTGRSTNGIVLMFNGGPVMWRSTLMKFVSSSSTFSEYGAMSDAVVAVEHAQGILSDILGLVNSGVVVYSQNEEAIGDIRSACESCESTELFVDNLAAIHIGTHDRGSKRAKCINVRFMNVRESVLREVIKLTWIPTEAQLADILTKCLEENLF
jgi:hypothetical protein